MTEEDNYDTMSDERLEEQPIRSYRFWMVSVELKAELERLRAIEARLLARWEHVQTAKINPKNKGLEPSYYGEQTAIILALGYDPSKQP